MLCQQVGIECIYISGKIDMGTQEGENTYWGNHAWNYVKVDDNWYLMDTSTDGAFAGMCGYAKFLLGSNNFVGDYELTTVDGGDDNCGTYGYTSLPTLSTSNYHWTEKP